MRPWIKPFVAGAFAGTALLAGVAAWSAGGMAVPAVYAAMHHRGGDPAAHAARFREMVVRHLDLDAAQTAKLDALMATVRQQHAALHGAGDPHAALLALVQGPAFDRAGAQTLLDTKMQQVRDGAPLVIASFGDFYDALRPDQQQALREFAAHHHGPGGMHGPAGMDGPASQAQ